MNDSRNTVWRSSYHKSSSSRQHLFVESNIQTFPVPSLDLLVDRGPVYHFRRAEKNEFAFSIHLV